MPIPSTNNSSAIERVLVDDLPYVDQEYGDPTLREAVNLVFLLCDNVSFCNRLSLWTLTTYLHVTPNAISLLKSPLLKSPIL